MKARIIVVLKEEVLDPQGRAVAKRLNTSGYPEVKEARVGKFIELNLETGDREHAQRRVIQMCKDLLANEMIEDYEILSLEG